MSAFLSLESRQMEILREKLIALKSKAALNDGYLDEKHLKILMKHSLISLKSGIKDCGNDHL